MRGSMRPMSGRCRHRGNSECWRYVRRKRGWYLREERSTRSIREGLAVPDQGEPRRPPTRPNLHIIPSRLTYTYPSTRPAVPRSLSPFHALPIAPLSFSLAPRFRLSVLTAAALWRSAITGQKLMFRMPRPPFLLERRVDGSIVSFENLSKIRFVDDRSIFESRGIWNFDRIWNFGRTNRLWSVRILHVEMMWYW